MTRILIAVTAALSASPALAASGPFFSLHNTDFVVTLAILLFVAVVVYFKVPAALGAILDKRAAGIRAELEEAKALRDEAHALLASYEKRQREVQEQSERIVANARDEAMAAAAKAKEDLKQSIARRVHAAEEQIASAEASAVREVRDRAVSVAIAAAGDLLAAGMTAKAGDALIAASIAEVEDRLQ